MTSPDTTSRVAGGSGDRRPAVDVRLRLLVAALLTVAAGIFAVGVTIERGRMSAQPSTVVTAPAHGPGGDADAGREPGAPVSSVAQATTTDESIFGIPADSLGLVIVALVLSLALAVAVVLVRHPAILLATGVVAAAFAVVDCAEVAHQLQNSRTLIAVLAAAVKGLHVFVILAAAGGAVLVARGRLTRA